MGSRSDLVEVFLGLGANLGDRRRNIELALERLAACPGIDVAAVSELIETDPVGGPPGQGRYLNGVAKIECALPAHALLQVCKELERRAGRDPSAPRNAARPLDLDILLFGEQRIDTRELRVPHPQLAERPFVRTPLAELSGIDVDALLPDPLEVLREIRSFAACCQRWHAGGCSIGLVPTMGALHQGHAALLRAARAECDRVVATVFVNPLQFGAGEDLDAYPRPFADDLALLRDERIDAVFAPQPSMMYPDGFNTSVRIAIESASLEGASRPGHFDGVSTVVAKLFNAARPTRAYFGQKDAQQVAVIRRMILDLDYPLELRVCGIVREPDGLALSSRNVYLGPSDRAAATALSRGLAAAQARFAAGERDPEALLATARAVIEAEPRIRLDYLELRREGDLQPLPPGPLTAGRMLVAAFVGEGPRPTRLIDNAGLGTGAEPACSGDGALS
ncbi:MAG: pantoate--beta-alanine ligase [Planctomycetes bacterium]|nr:pantoate--beta-alanine ligase [Planctomycetota bacterium]